jgi:hypothetical protein
MLWLLTSIFTNQIIYISKPNSAIHTCPNNTLPSPPTNDNWQQVDLSSKFVLKYGEVLNNTPTLSNATFRRPVDMNNSRMACQFWMPDGSLDFVNPGYNPYLIGVGYGDLFNGSHGCGQCLLIRNPANNIFILSMISDYIPNAVYPNQLDIQSAGSAFLNTNSSYYSTPGRGGPKNFVGLQVWKTECVWGGHPLQYYFTVGSNQFHWYVVIMWNTGIFDNIEIYTCDMYPIDTVLSHDGYGRWDFNFPNRQGYEGVYKIKLWRGSNFFIDKIYYPGCSECLVNGTTADYALGPVKSVPMWPLQ